MDLAKSRGMDIGMDWLSQHDHNGHRHLTHIFFVLIVSPCPMLCLWFLLGGTTRTETKV